MRSIKYAVLALAFFFPLFSHAVGIWTLDVGTWCGTTGDDKCVYKGTSGSATYSAIFQRDLEATLLWDGSTQNLFDFTNYATPYQLYGQKGLGDWPQFDGQVVGLPSENACDGMTLGECLAVEGVFDEICASYPGGVYQAFTLETCLTAESNPDPEPTPTTSVATSTLDAISFSTTGILLFLVFISVAYAVVSMFP